VPGLFGAEKLNGLPWIIDDKVLEILVVANSLGSIHTFRPFTVHLTSKIADLTERINKHDEVVWKREGILRD
jgi:hypothetical protein